MIFNWLNLLDMNVWVILVLMILVSGFTMISGLLIIIPVSYTHLEEAAKYFPLYNDLSKKKFELHKQHRDKVEMMKQRNKNMTDEEYRQLLENDVDLKLKEAELEKQYAEKLEKILSPEKLYRAQQAERKFMQQEVMKFM